MNAHAPLIAANLKPYVLVVDDDPLLREIAVEMLSTDGYPCAAAEDGDVAIAMMSARPADLVVLDMIMPNREGLETLGVIKTRWPATTVIMISAGTRAMMAGDLLTTAKALGADAVMHKPLQAAAFLALVERTLARRPSA